MKRLALCVLVALLMAGVLGATAGSTPFRERLLDAELDDALAPAVTRSLNVESTALKTVLLAYANEPTLLLAARLAVLRHGDIARRVLGEYGLDGDFQRALSRFDADAVLPVAYFHDHEITTLNLRHWMAQRYRQASRTLSDWWSDDDASRQAPGQAGAEAPGSPSGNTTDSGAQGSLTPHQRGDYAVAWLNREGHGVLDQFVVDDRHRVAWLQGERVVSDVSDFFTSGLRDLERKWQQGEPIRASDAAWAGVDLLAMTSAIKVLRVGRGARVAGAEAQSARTGSRASRGLLPGLKFARLSRPAKFAALGATGWLVVRHPSLVSAFGATLARWLDWPVKLVQFGVWALILTPVLWLAGLLYRWLIAPLLGVLDRLTGAAARTRHSAG
ncbi:hypothetical protein C7446_2835 [Kushneria sinocarnis]|uniref:Uncharacterized protein n=1 Tax=Kushneria sinocarnis TaxID=595502 RepID=A0A420WU58_9GAMM|nr:hypothetical protein [Kushneria sinocarnis]RKQ96974.1 hypothetical protein C7446_2835 [Kushneria sinocarnis]